MGRHPGAKDVPDLNHLPAIGAAGPVRHGLIGGDGERVCLRASMPEPRRKHCSFAFNLKSDRRAAAWCAGPIPCAKRRIAGRQSQVDARVRRGTTRHGCRTCRVQSRICCRRPVHCCGPGAALGFVAGDVALVIELLDMHCLALLLAGIFVLVFERHDPLPGIRGEPRHHNGLRTGRAP